MTDQSNDGDYSLSELESQIKELKEKFEKGLSEEKNFRSIHQTHQKLMLLRNARANLLSGKGYKPIDGGLGEV
ncbi:MAG: hypothetical protein C5B59_03785 [Bacteroidetes bacterium]|nr:MAG: hypothetical protein C5B59_03785 [Bacteroidota bacterium]